MAKKKSSARKKSIGGARKTASLKVKPAGKRGAMGGPFNPPFSGKRGKK